MLGKAERQMGYTHHWYRPPVIDKEIFQGIRADFEKLILPLADVGVPLAGWRGTDAPRSRMRRFASTDYAIADIPQTRTSSCHIPPTTPTESALVPQRLVSVTPIFVSTMKLSCFPGWQIEGKRSPMTRKHEGSFFIGRKLPLSRTTSRS